MQAVSTHSFSLVELTSFPHHANVSNQLLLECTVNKSEFQQEKYLPFISYIADASRQNIMKRLGNFTKPDIIYLLPEYEVPCSEGRLHCNWLLLIWLCDVLSVSLQFSWRQYLRNRKWKRYAVVFNKSRLNS